MQEIKTKRWVFDEFLEDKVSALQQELNIHPSLCQILVNRGVDTFDKAKSFFNPSLDDLHDPFLMKDMDKATTRVSEAITNHEKIMVYGDYDVDGTTSVATMYSFLVEAGANAIYYIPDRYKEGYGVSETGIEYASEVGVGLIITLDCGIKAVDKVDFANSKNIDVIICDHHRPGDVLPNAFAVLDPKRKDCDYPFKELSGCGVGFKLIQAIVEQNNLPKEKAFEYLDLLAISIAADIVPIEDENRILAHFGLVKLNKNPRVGLKTMMDLAAEKTSWNISDIVFVLAPRINAAGRIGHAHNAVKALIAESEDAFEFATALNERNVERRGFDQSITQEAIKIVSASEHTLNKKSIVVFQPHWHKGVVGIVASRLIEQFYKPSIVLTMNSDGLVTGSARSVMGFDVYNAIDACSEYLNQFGGHMYAAGLTMEMKDVEAFSEAFEKYVEEHITEEMLTPEIQINADLPLEAINNRFYNTLRRMSPFGPCNMKPVFVSKNVVDNGYSKVVKEKHIKFSLTRENASSISGIGFGLGHKFDVMEYKKPFDVVYTVEENEWRGRVNLQLLVKDLG